MSKKLNVTSENKPLLDKRAGLVTEMENIKKKAVEEKRDMTKEEGEKFDLLDTQAEELYKNAERVSRLHDLNSEEKDALKEAAGKTGSAEELKERQMSESRAFGNFIRFGENKLSAEERSILNDLKTRAQSTTGSAGGYMIPQGFMAELVKALKAFGGVRNVARIVSTSTGNTIPWPKMNDTGNVGELLAENTQVSEQDATFGVTNLLAYKYSSKAVRVSNELLQDSEINVEQLLAEALAERIGRITNTHFTTGDNSSKPQGIVTAGSSGATSATGTALVYADLVNLEHSVDPSYRKNAKFMMNDGVLKAIKKLTIGSSDSTPLWDPGIMKMGAPATILGYQYEINQDMQSTLAVTTKTILFGDFNYYVIRDVLNFSLRRLVERYADYDQVGFFAFSRHDGRCIASDNPFKYLTMANT